MISLDDLKIKLFADGADKEGMLEMYRNPAIRGFTTNPTLMRKAGVRDYCAFAAEIVAAIPDRPISFEVFSDDFDVMEQQAMEIASWGSEVNVKIPITNTKGEPCYALLKRLAQAGVKLNVTAVLTLDQVRGALECVAGGPRSFISIFAGRIADTGRDPIPIMSQSVAMVAEAQNIELIWASPRELLNVMQADAVGCHIITATNDILKKLTLIGKDLGDYSLDTVKMFHGDAAAAEYQIPLNKRQSISVSAEPGAQMVAA